MPRRVWGDSKAWLTTKDVNIRGASAMDAMPLMS